MLKVLYWIFDIFTYLLIIPIVLVAFTGHIPQRYSPLIFGVAYAFLAARQILDWRVHPGQKLSKLDKFLYASYIILSLLYLYGFWRQMR